MNDLIFKNIPEEGFETKNRFTERVSNPTPSRKNSSFSQTETAFPVSEQCVSNPTLSENQSVQPQMLSQESRLSSPTPTRRRRVSDKTIIAASSDDYNSRLSNATPTRRCSRKTDNSSSTVISGAESGRDSNPTPRRRVNSFISEVLPSPETEQLQPDFHNNQSESTLNRTDNILPVNPVPDQTEEDVESLSFTSVDNPYGLKENNIRTSASPIVRKPFESETVSGSDNADNNRLSNYTPTHRK